MQAAQLVENEKERSFFNSGAESAGEIYSTIEEVELT